MDKEIKAQPDWEAIQLAYRAATPSIRALAAQHGITEGAIRKRAKNEEWTRDLAAKVKYKRDDLVRTAEVRSQVRTDSKRQSAYSEKQKVEISATIQANKILEHRVDIARTRGVTMLLLSELEAICGPDAAAMLAELGELLRSPDDRGVDRLNDIYKTIISLPERAKTMKSLADSLRVLVDMERTAFSMDEDAGEGGSGNDKPMSDAELAVRLFQVFGSKQA